MIDLYGILALIDAFVHDQWPGMLFGVFVTFIVVSAIYEQWIVERE